MSLVAMQQFVSNLKSKNELAREKAANELSLYVKNDLREATPEEITNFLDKFNHYIFEMVSSNDVNEKKGGILAIVSLIGADVGNMTTRISRFANYLRNLLPSNDVGVMELVARTMGRLALVSGSKASEYVEFEVKTAFEWLSGDRIEAKRHAAVLVLKELADSMPTYFYQQVSQFFDLIFVAIQDPKQAIREAAIEALKAALVVTAQREIVKENQREASSWLDSLQLTYNKI